MRLLSLPFSSLAEGIGNKLFETPKGLHNPLLLYIIILYTELKSFPPNVLPPSQEPGPIERFLLEFLVP